MTAHGVDDQHDPETAFDARLDELCDRFETAWKSGVEPRIEEFLDGEPALRDAAMRAAALREFVQLDLAYRWLNRASDAADSPTVGTGSAGASFPKRLLLEDYVAKFPQLGPLAQLPPELVLQEYDGRRACGEEPSFREYAERFASRHDILGALASRERAARETDRRDDGRPLAKSISEPRSMQIRCPHCHNPVEVVLDRLLADITCSVCGSSFSLIGTGTETRRTATLTKVGHYELIEQLGIGGFGTVWKARDTELDRTVAIKIPRKGQLDSQESEQFLREARAAAQLRHPHIVSVHEAGRDGDTLYIVSDFVRGVTLKDWLTAHRLSEREAAQLCATVAEALDHAHRAGVVHRDLKPSNIMLDAAGTPHLMDFGLAKREAGEITMTIEGRILGTPAYMSPEQAKGEGHQADRRSDIYSLGVILFELLTGELPFRGNERMMLLQVISDPAPAPRRLNRTISRDLETIALKCLEKDPRRRYDTAADVAAELRRYLDGRPIVARPIGFLERGWRWCQRQPVVAGLGAAVALALLVGTAVSLHFARESGFRANREEQQRMRAERQLRVTTAQRLAFQAREVLNSHPQRSLLLAVEAVKATSHFDEPVVPLAEEALHEALANVGGEPLAGHRREVETAAFSPDGRWIVTVSDDGTARFWDQHLPQDSRSGYVLALGPSGEDEDAVEQKRALVVAGEPPQRFPLAFSADGRWACVAGADGRALVCDLHVENPARRPIRLDAARGAVTRLVFSADSTRLITAGADDGSARIWPCFGPSRFSAAVELPGHGDGVTCLAMSPSNRWLALGSGGGSVRLWDMAATVPTATSTQLSASPNAKVAKIAFSADAKWLGAAYEPSPYEGGEQVRVVARLWDMTSGEPAKATLELREMQKYSVAFEFSPDGRFALTYSDSSEHSVTLWDLSRADPTQQPLQFGVGEDIRSVAVCSGTETCWLAVGTSQWRTAIWEVRHGTDATPAPAIWREHTSAVQALAFSSEGRRLASGDVDGTVRLWDLEDANRRQPGGRLSRVLRGHEGPITSLSFSSDGSQLATAGRDGIARVWDLALPARTADAITLHGALGLDKPMTISPDARWLATQDAKGGVALWDLVQGGPFTPPIMIGGDLDHPVTSIALARNARWLAACTSHGDAWILPGAGPTSTDPTKVLSDVARANGVSISSNGRWLAARGADSVTLWRINDLGVAGEGMTLTHPGEAILFMAMTAPPHRLVTVGQHIVRIWDLEAASPSSAYHELIAGEITSFAFSPNNGRLVARETGLNEISVAGGRRPVGPTVYMCNLDGQPPAPTPLGISLEAVAPMLAVCNDGRFLAAGHRDGHIELWDLARFAANVAAPRSVLREHESQITVLRFNVDGSRLLSADAGGVARLWDLTAAAVESSSVALRGHNDSINAAVFTDNDRLLVTASRDGDYRVWILPVDELVNRARRAAGRGLTEPERRKYLPIDLHDAHY